MQTLIFCDEQCFALDAAFDGQPVKLPEHRGDILLLAPPKYHSDAGILHTRRRRNRVSGRSASWLLHPSSRLIIQREVSEAPTSERQTGLCTIYRNSTNNPSMDTNTGEVHFRRLHDALTNNYWLKKWGVVDSGFCTFHGEDAGSYCSFIVAV